MHMENVLGRKACFQKAALYSLCPVAGKNGKLHGGCRIAAMLFVLLLSIEVAAKHCDFSGRNFAKCLQGI